MADNAAPGGTGRKAERPAPAVHRPWAPQGSVAGERVEEGACPPGARPFVLAATIVGSSLAFIDGTIVYIALPAIQASTHASFSQLQWIVNIYTLLLGALVLVGGSLGDRIGRRRVFVIGLLVFTAASLLCALANDAPTLLIGRCAQGLGAALLVPQSLAIIAAAFPREVRGRAIGTWAAWAAVTTALGPGLGGVLIDLMSWRAAFAINLPLAALALWLTWRYMPESRLRDGEVSLDFRGAGLATLGLGALTYALTGIPKLGFTSLEVMAALVAAIVLLGGFVLSERLTSSPMIPPDLLVVPQFVVANVMTLMLYFTLGGILFLLPYSLIQARGLDASTIGLAMTPFGIIMGLWSKFAGIMADRFGVRPLLTVGPLIVAVACIGFGWPILGDDIWGTAVIPIVVVAVGLALTMGPLTTAVMNSVPESRSGIASGVNNSASRVAGLIAVALMGSVMAALFEPELSHSAMELGLAADIEAIVVASAKTLSLPDLPGSVSEAVAAAIQGRWNMAFLDAFKWAMTIAAVSAAAAGLTAWFGLKARPRPRR